MKVNRREEAEEIENLIQSLSFEAPAKKQPCGNAFIVFLILFSALAGVVGIGLMVCWTALRFRNAKPHPSPTHAICNHPCFKCGQFTCVAIYTLFNFALCAEMVAALGDDGRRRFRRGDTLGERMMGCCEKQHNLLCKPNLLGANPICWEPYGWLWAPGICASNICICLFELMQSCCWLLS